MKNFMESDVFAMQNSKKDKEFFCLLYQLQPPSPGVGHVPHQVSGPLRGGGGPGAGQQHAQHGPDERALRHAQPLQVGGEPGSARKRKEPARLPLHPAAIKEQLLPLARAAAREV